MRDARFPRRPAALCFAVRVLVCSLGLLAYGRSAMAQGAGTVGQWDPNHRDFYTFPSCPADTDEVSIIHMSLVRDSLNNSGIVYTNKAASTGLFKWTSADSIQSTIMHLTNPGHEVFCGGHVTLSDGKLLILGGDGPWPSYDYDSYWTGSPLAVTFNMSRATSCTATGAWTARHVMNLPRWYPTATVLSDGKVLATSGNMYASAVLFGGVVAGGVSKDAHLLAQSGPMDYKSLSPTGTAPSARSGHVAVFDRSPGDDFTNRMLTVGGDSAGTLSAMTVFALNRDDRLTPSEPYSWSTITASGTAPSGRSRAAAIMDLGGSSRFFIAGGKNGSDQALNSLWGLTLGAAGASSGSWRQYTNMPIALYGHSAIYDQPRNRIVVFGGRDSTAVYGRLFVYTIADSTWSEPAFTGTAPSAREGHAACVNADCSKMYVSGGRNGGTYYNDFYELNLSSLVWTQKTSTHTFSARAEHSMFIDDSDYERFVVYGGIGGSGALSDCWDYSFLPWVYPSSSLSDWVQESTTGSPATRYGHTMFYDPRGTFANTPEVYDPSGDTWTPLTGMERYLPTYPRMLLLPNGEVFFAGPDTDTRKLNVSSGWSSSYTSLDLGEGAVQFLPGKIMKCGGTGKTELISFDGSGATSGWQHPSGSDLSGMSTRDHFNLTMLPTGQVLLNGGTVDMDIHSGATKVPYIWTPPTGSGAGTWSSALATEPENRGYHSTTLLLPDARILSAGGFPGADPERMYARVYSPPYLFDPTTNLLAPRPAIDTAPDTVAYASTQAQFYICLTGAATQIAKVSLIRAGQVTHGFNMGQNFASLSFTSDGTSGCKRIRVSAPANSAVAPAGDYLLFVVNTAGVPSVARWVRVCATAGTNPSCASECDIPPATITDLVATSHCDKVTLEWTAPGDDGSTGQATQYDLRRSSSSITNDTQFYAATPISISAPQTAGSAESYDDNLGHCSGGKYYRLKTVDDAGNWSSMSNEVTGATSCSNHCIELALGQPPRVLELSTPWPNPSGNEFSVSYAIPAAQAGQPFDLAIYNVAGRRIATMASGLAVVGRHLEEWTGDPRVAATGVYFLRLRVAGHVLSRSLVRAR